MLRRLPVIVALSGLLLSTVPLVATPAATAATSAILCAQVKNRSWETSKEALTNFESKIGRNLGGHRQWEFWDSKFPNAGYDDDVANKRVPMAAWGAKKPGGVVVPWRDIASGKEDDIIKTRAQAIKAWGKRMYLAFHHEPENDTAKNGTAADYIAAFRRIRDVFDAQGVTNVSWLWGPIMVYTFEGANGGPDAWYPGDRYIDFVGVNGYNWYPGRPYTKWRSFREIFDTAYAYAVAKNKPLVIYETGVQEHPSDSNAKAQWYRDALATVKGWPLLNTMCYYHSDQIYPWWIDTTTQSLNSFKELANDPVFGGTAPPPPPPGEFDLSITKSASPASVTAGSDVTYTLTATNSSASANDAPGVTVTDRLPSGVTFKSAAPAASCSGTSTVTCSLGTLAKGASAKVDIVVTANEAGTITNTASVSGSGTDANNANNSASASTTVNSPPATEADLSITQTDSPDPVTVGSNLTYTLTVRNSGLNATGVTVSDTLPSAVSFVSASPSCTGTGPVTCSLGDLAQGASTQVQIVVRPDAAGTITNNASVSTSTAESNTANNSSSAVTTVESVSATPTTTIQVANYSFTPTPAIVQQGGIAKWVFNSTHTATDRSGMNLFDSGSKSAGETYSFTFPWAGRFPYKCSLHQKSASTNHRGIVAVPIVATPEKGGPGTVFMITWAKAAPPSGFAFDVQVKKPNATAFVDWKLGVTAMSDTYAPDAGTGGYRFRSRLRNLTTGKMSFWSNEDYFSYTK